MFKQLKDISSELGKNCKSCEKITNGEAKDKEGRCCDEIFCGAVERGFKALGVSYERTDHPTIPFMGEKGCVVAPEHRPGCTTFFCSHALTSRKDKRFYERKMEKLKTDPEFVKYMDCVNITEIDLRSALQKLGGIRCP